MAKYFTPKGFRKYQEEIQKLNDELTAMQSRVSHVAEMGGDSWHDNPSYNQLTGEIRQTDQYLRQRLADISGATVIDRPKRADTVDIGTVVRIRRDGKREETWTIAGYGESDPDNDIVAYNTPMADMLLGKKVGETAQGEIAKRVVAFEILEINLDPKW